MNALKLFVSAAAAATVVGAIGVASAQSTDPNAAQPTTPPTTTTEPMAAPGATPPATTSQPSTTDQMNQGATTSSDPVAERAAQADRN